MAAQVREQMTSRIRSCWLAALMVAAFAFSGCTKVPQDKSVDAIDEDPLEPFNRVMYEFNYVFDGAILRPITMIYRGIVP
jgi:ABC-type transporter lipoprotein component MlaA